MTPSYDSGFDSLYGSFTEGPGWGRSHQEIAGNRVSVTQEKGQEDGTSMESTSPES